MSICLNCNIEFTPGRNTASKYCSLKCQAALKSKEVVNRWIENPCVETYYTGNQVRGAIRRYLLNGCGLKCTICGWGEMHPSSKLPPLEVDHIDGDWRNCVTSNLRVICPNCHSLTDTYKSRNRGKGRHGR